jgi:PAS domain S-box-containing protein
MRSRSNELIGPALALAILASVAVLGYRSIDAATDTLGWVEHTNDVLRDLADVSSAFARSTSARRAYVVAADASQLSTLADADARLARSVATLRSALADNPRQRERLDVLDRLMTERLADLDRLVARRRSEGTVAETANDVELSGKIRSIREELEGAEAVVLAERDAATRRDIAQTKLAVVVGTLVSFAILILAFQRLRQEVARRRTIEEALRASESFLDSIVENIPDMIFVKEAKSLRFERINRAGELLLGVDRSALLGKSDFDFFPRAQAEFFQARDRETFSSRAIVDVAEEPIVTKNGERWLHTKKVPIFDDAGAQKYLVGISVDITEARRSARALEDAKDAAESANKELATFSYAVAHDLRAPLRAIDGFTTALEEDCGSQLNGQGREHLARVTGAIRQMGQLIDGLLDLSQLTRGAIRRGHVDLSRIAREIAERLRASEPTRDCEVVIDDGLEVEGDARLLTAVMENLLQNAWKFSAKRASARIEVGQRIDGDRRIFFVRDNGAGFDQAYAHNLFGAFQRLHSTTEFEGTGIGLATVHRIVRRHGGEVWAEGEVDRGATFFFTL